MNFTPLAKSRKGSSSNGECSKLPDMVTHIHLPKGHSELSLPSSPYSLSFSPSCARTCNHGRKRRLAPSSLVGVGGSEKGYRRPCELCQCVTLDLKKIQLAYKSHVDWRNEKFCCCNHSVSEDLDELSENRKLIFCWFGCLHAFCCSFLEVRMLKKRGVGFGRTAYIF